MRSNEILTILILFNFRDSVLAADPDKVKEFKPNGPKIINGTEAVWNGTRHQVSVRLKDRDWYFGAGHICGGSLIAEDIVLTAAHCIWNFNKNVFRTADEFSVTMGNLDRFDRNHTLDFNVTKISKLPTADMDTFRDDIAIMFLSGKVPKNFTYASPIELNKVHGLRSGTKCEVSGWGVMESNLYPSRLMVVDVAIINRTICSRNYDILDGMICAGYLEGERDACQGDSGGPLKCGNKLVGVVSFGSGCALPDYPGVYAEVAHYIEWINKEIGRSGAAIFLPMNLFMIIFFWIHWFLKNIFIF